MEKEIKKIINKCQQGEMGEDEKGAGGFWDLAGKLAEVGEPDQMLPEFENKQEERQEAIYNALKQVYRTLNEYKEAYGIFLNNWESFTREQQDEINALLNKVFKINKKEQV